MRVSDFGVIFFDYFPQFAALASVFDFAVSFGSASRWFSNSGVAFQTHPGDGR